MKMSYLTYGIREGMRDEAMAKIEDAGFLQKFRAEPGCLSYQLYLPVDDPNSIAAVDIWESMEAVAAHAQSQNAKDYYDVLRPYVVHVDSLHYTSDAFLQSLARPDFSSDGI